MSDSSTHSGDTLTNTNLLDGVVLFSDLVDTQFGPDSRSKLIESEKGTTVTADIHRLLDELDLEHPGARIVAQGAVEQKERVGDGSLAVILIVGGLAEQTQGLLDRGFHRATIAEGFNRARQAALEVLPTFTTQVEGLESTIGRAVIRTVLNTSTDSEDTIDTVVDAARLIARETTQTRGLQLSDIEFRQMPATEIPGVDLLRGMILAREPVTRNTPHKLENPQVAIIGGGKKAGSGIEERELKRAGGSKGEGRSEVTATATSFDDIQAFRQYEQEDIQDQVQTLSEAGVDVVFTTMGISDTAIAALDAAGIVAFRRLTSNHARQLSRATGADIVMDIDDFSPANRGKAGQLEIFSQNEESFVRIDGCDHGQLATILFSHTLEEGTEDFERTLMSAIVMALKIIDGNSAVPGGGGIETRLAAAVRTAATSTPDRTALVMDAYADALERIPRTLARNAGDDSIDVVTKLRAGHDDFGLDSRTDSIQSTVPHGPLLLEEVVKTGVNAATEIAIQLVRVDEVVPAASDEDTSTDFDLTPDADRDRE